MKLMHALIVPDFNDRNDERYRAVGTVFQSYDITPAFAPIDWNRTVLTRNVAQFSNRYERYDRRTTVIFGYSLGAMIAFVQSSVRPPAALVLASMEPWFKEDMVRRPTAQVAALGLRRMADYENFHFDTLVNGVVSPTYILLGAEEAARLPVMRDRAQAVHDQVTGSKLIMVSNAQSGLASPAYLDALSSVVARLIESSRSVG
jgi:hypothetical protein